MTDHEQGLKLQDWDENLGPWAENTSGVSNWCWSVTFIPNSAPRALTLSHSGWQPTEGYGTQTFLSMLTCDSWAPLELLSTKSLKNLPECRPWAIGHTQTYLRHPPEAGWRPCAHPWSTGGQVGVPRTTQLAPGIPVRQSRCQWLLQR